MIAAAVSHVQNAHVFLLSWFTKLAIVAIMLTCLQNAFVCLQA